MMLSQVVPDVGPICFDDFPVLLHFSSTPAAARAA